MNEHAGAGCFFSVLVIIAFTLVFHEVERPKQASSSPPMLPRGASADSPAPDPDPAIPPSSVATRVEPIPTKPEGLPTAVAPQVVSISMISIVPTSSPPPATDPSIKRPAEAATISREAPPTRRRDHEVSNRRLDVAEAAKPKERGTNAAGQEPRASFTIVEPGERLVDVASRVYGTPEAAATLWRANRDRLRGVDAPVAAGLLIRTPPRGR